MHLTTKWLKQKLFRSLASGIVLSLIALKAQAATIYVSPYTFSASAPGEFNGTVEKFDSATLADLGTFTSGPGPQGLAFGPDGNLYINFLDGSTPDGASGFIAKFNSTTGESLGRLPNNGPLNFPRGLTFGPDGNIYDAARGLVQKFNPTTGQYLGNFALGGNPDSILSLAFGPDGNLYVSNFNNGNIEKYNGTTGTDLGSFINVGVSGGLTFGPDGNLYTISNGAVEKYNGTTGVDLGSYATFSSTSSFLAFSPTVVPEPSSVLGTLALGVLGAASFMLRRRKSA